MRFLSTITRSIIAAATSLHISALRAAVWSSDRTVKAAMLVTDAADVGVAKAKDIVKLAEEGQREAWELEKATIKANNQFRVACQVEAAALRRGIIL